MKREMRNSDRFQSQQRILAYLDGLIKVAENSDTLGEPVIRLSRKVLFLLTGEANK